MYKENIIRGDVARAFFFSPLDRWDGRLKRDDAKPAAAFFFS
jgi:hypothetical protein